MEQNARSDLLSSYKKINEKFPVVPTVFLAISFVGAILSRCFYTIASFSNIPSAFNVSSGIGTVVCDVLKCIIGMLPYLVAFVAIAVGALLNQKGRLGFISGIGFAIMTIVSFVSVISLLITTIATIKYYSLVSVMLNGLSIIISLVITVGWGITAVGFIFKKPKITEFLRLGGAALILISSLATRLCNLLWLFTKNHPIGFWGIMGHITSLVLFSFGIVLFILTYEDLFLNIKSLFSSVKNKAEEISEE